MTNDQIERRAAELTYATILKMKSFPAMPLYETDLIKSALVAIAREAARPMDADDKAAVERIKSLQRDVESCRGRESQVDMKPINLGRLSDDLKRLLAMVEART